MAVRNSNESQGGKVTFNAGSKGNSTITVTTKDGSKTTLKEGKDYYIGKDGSAYYTNNSSNSVRSSNESGGNSVSYSAGSSSGNSTITVTSSNSNTKTTLKEGKDYYLGNDGKAYYYNDVRSVSNANGNSVSYSSGSSKGSSSITVTNPITNQTTTLKEGKDYYIGADGKAHYFTGAPSTGPIKPTNKVTESTSKISAADVQKAFQNSIRGGDFDNAYGLQCADLTKWFIDTYTTLDWARGDGSQQAANIAALNNLSAPSSDPKAFSVFSVVGGYKVWGSSGSEYGHTGIVLSVDEVNKTCTVIHTGSKREGKTPNSWISTYSYPANGVTFTYIGDYLK